MNFMPNETIKTFETLFHTFMCDCIVLFNNALNARLDLTMTTRNLCLKCAQDFLEAHKTNLIHNRIYCELTKEV